MVAMFSSPELSPLIRSVFSDKKAAKVTTDTLQLWLICAVVLRLKHFFIKKFGITSKTDCSIERSLKALDGMECIDTSDLPTEVTVKHEQEIRAIFKEEMKEDKSIEC